MAQYRKDPNDPIDVQFGNDLNPTDYIDVNLSNKVCLVCSLPFEKRKDFEFNLFKSFNKEKSAKEYGFEIADIDNHLEKCILERETVIPIGQLINNLVGQLNNYLAELDRFRLALNTERNPDSMTAYTGAFKELRQTIEALSKLKTPHTLGGQIKNEAIRPLIMSMLKSMIEKLKEIRTDVIELAGEENKSTVDSKFKAAAQSWGQFANKRNEETLAKVAEILGLDPAELED